MLPLAVRLLFATSSLLVSGWCTIKSTHAAATKEETKNATGSDRYDDAYFLEHWSNTSHSLQIERHLSSSPSTAVIGGLQPFWLAGEAKVLASDIAFGFYKEHLEGSGAAGTSADEVAAIADLFLRWWVPGLVGCLFRESADAYPRTSQMKGQGIGLEDCIFPRELVAKCPWFRASPTASFVVTPLLLAAKFPNRKWYVLADCDTIFSPLALAQFLETYSPTEDWYIGSRSENVGARRSQGWDMASVGAGVVLSGHLLEPSVALLARCFDAAPWSKSPSGAWVLHRCLGRLGIPLTAVAGFKAMDEKHPVLLRHLLEASPMGGGLLSVKAKQNNGLFMHGSRISEPAFFASLFRDPIALGASCVCEVRVGGRAGLFTATVSAGLSVRLWPGRFSSQLWDFTRSEALSPPPGVKAKKTVFENTGENMIRYTYNARQPPLVKASTIPSVYLPERHVATHSGEKGSAAEQWRRRRLGAGRERYPWIAVVVVEEIMKEGLPLLVGARRGLCHLAAHEVVFTGGSAGDSGSVLVLRIRDCAHQHAPPSSEKKEILGGLAGSALANMIHQDGGGPANTYTGMRERNLGAFQPAFLGIPVAETLRRARRTRIRRRRLQVYESGSINNDTATFVDGVSTGTMSGGYATEVVRRLASAAEATINPSDCTWVAWRAKMVCGATDGKGHTHTVSSTPKGKAPWHGSSTSSQQLSLDDGSSSGPESWVSQSGASIATMPEANLVASGATPSWLSNKAPLQDEYKFAIANMAFGIISSAATVSQRLELLKLWWLPGAQGCLSLDKHVSANTLGHLLPPGLDVCGVPWHIQKKAWMKQGVKGRGLHRGAILHLILHGRFALKKWYIVGDDDTLFNPLALAQYLSAYDASSTWYFGGRSEMMDTRHRIGWDMAYGGGGVVLSSGFMVGYGEALERCFDDAPWFAAPGGDWVLAKCVGRLGVPLTQGGGFHQFDEGGPNMIRDALERHPVAPLLSVVYWRLGALLASFQACLWIRNRRLLGTQKNRGGIERAINVFASSLTFRPRCTMSRESSSPGSRLYPTS